MKCKSWSNKINNLVVRRLKSIKLSGQQTQSVSTSQSQSQSLQQTQTQSQTQQQQQQQPLQQQQQQQQQISSNCSTMPAMPKEIATAVSLNESNFSELKLKELTSNSSTVTSCSAESVLQQHRNSCDCSAAVDGATGCGMCALRHSNAYIGSNGHLPLVGRQSTASMISAAATVTQSHAFHVAQLIGSGNGSGSGSGGGTNTDLATKHNNYKNNNNNNNNNNSVKSDQQQQQQQQLHNQNLMAASSRISNELPSTSAAAVATSSTSTSSSASGLASGSSSAGTARTNATATSTAAAAVSASEVPSSTTATASPSASASGAAATATPPKKSPKDYMFGKYIGEGSFSVVYLAVELATKREYAIKVCEKRHILREHKQEYIRREREVMHMMNNVPGFVNLSCTFQDNRSLYFVMTYAKNGDMLPYINKVGSFDVDCTRHYAAELVLACEQMHRCNVVHRDLKPENILLDEDMHTLIADFGSAKILQPGEVEAAAASISCASEEAAAGAGSSGTASRNSSSTRQPRTNNRNNTDDDDDTNESTSDDDDSPSRQPRYQRRRRGSFVGTAQYVSPEVLQNKPITPSADLWALGCIIYQMISGLPPFRGSNDYVIFRHILNGHLEFPEGFDKDAEDLVRKLLKMNPVERLGATDEGYRYESIRSHPFFAGIDIDKVRQCTPPPIYPYLPGVSEDEDFHYDLTENFEPGLDDRQRTRLLGIKLGTSMAYCGDASGGSGSSGSSVAETTEKKKKTATKNPFDLTEAEKQKRLEVQKSDTWNAFADNEVILKKGFVNKRKGLFARKRMLLLTTGPRLIYIDPVNMLKKGEIPWSPELRADPKNFKIFFVHTPNRTYYLDDPEGNSPYWVEAIEKMAELTYGNRAKRTTSTFTTTAPVASSSTTTISNSIPIPLAATPPTAATSTSPSASTSTSPLSGMTFAANSNHQNQNQNQQRQLNATPASMSRQQHNTSNSSSNGSVKTPPNNSHRINVSY